MECERCFMIYSNDIIYKTNINGIDYDVCGWCICYLRTYHLIEIGKNKYITKIKL